MANSTGSCSVCGAPLAAKIGGVFDGAGIIGVCSACAEQQLLADGGASFQLDELLPHALFLLRDIRITPGAIAVLAEARQHAYEFLLRHAQGDWGRYGRTEEICLSADEERRGWEATDEDGKINKSNLFNRRDRIMSAYTTGAGEELWIITSLDRNGNTTVLVPEEY